MTDKRQRIRPTDLPEGQITWSQPTNVTLDGGPTVPVHTWRGVLTYVAGELIQRHPESLTKLERFRGKKGRLYVSSTQEALRDPVRLATGVFIEGNLSAKSVVGLLHKLMQICGRSPEELRLETEPRT